jgi:GNAT superfamily N-acetyltransferase
MNQRTVHFEYGENDMKHTKIRFATEADTALILGFIKELAEYEKMSDQVVADEALLHEWIFEKKKAEVIFALEDGVEVGFALFFHNFSTFLGRAGLYLEDLFVKPAYRGRGHGKALIRELARIAVARGCGRLEWCCLDWNQPSIDFYLSLGALPMDEWTTYRLSGEGLTSFAEGE